MKVYRFKCKDCGSKTYEKIDDTIYQCVYCGYREEVHMEEPKKEEKKEDPTPRVEVEFVPEVNKSHNKSARYIVLLIACIFGGTFGVHRFMQGKIFTGLIYLCSFGLFGIGVFFDLIGIAIKLAHASKEEKYVSYRKVVRERDNNE